MLFNAVLALVVSAAISFAVLCVNENMPAPDGRFRGGWILGAAWLVTAWGWISFFLS